MQSLGEDRLFNFAGSCSHTSGKVGNSIAFFILRGNEVSLNGSSGIQWVILCNFDKTESRQSENGAKKMTGKLPIKRIAQ